MINNVLDQDLIGPHEDCGPLGAQDGGWQGFLLKDMG